MSSDARARPGLSPEPRPGETRPGVRAETRGIPDLPEGLVTRPRLLDLLEQGVQGSLTLLSAPAGTGKTVLVANWARTSTSGYDVVWLTTPQDGGARQVWPRLLGALERAGVGAPRLGVPSDVSSPSEAWLSRLAATFAAHSRPVVLVLDQAEQAHPALHRSLATLMRSARGSPRVVLLTRSDPMLPLNSYRLDDQLTEIRAARLAFGEEEAAELFEKADIFLTPAQVTTLVKRTSGWAVGLTLATMGLHGTDDQAAAVAAFAGDQDNVSAYLTTEVLRWQPPLLREVLLRTSIVDALSPGLFEALTDQGSGQSAMAFMSRGSSFIETVPDVPGWYQYQSLVRDFLRAQLAFERPLLVPELHRAAADWYAHNGFLTKAVRHAATVGAWDDAAGYLIEDLGIGSLLAEIWNSGRAATFAKMPYDEAVTPVAIVRAALDLGAGDAEACGRDLASARTSLAAESMSSPASAFSIALLDALSAVTEPDVESGLASALIAEHQLRGNYPEAARTRPELTLLLALARARLYLWQGDLPSAAEALEGLFVGETAPSTGRLSVVVLGLQGLVDSIRGHPSEALRHADAAEDLARTAGVDVATWSWEVPAARAWVRVDELDLPAAAVQVRAAETAAAASSDMTGHLTAGLLLLVRAHLLGAQGHQRAARDALTQARPPLTDQLVEAAQPLRRPPEQSTGAHGHPSGSAHPLPRQRTPSGSPAPRRTKEASVSAGSTGAPPRVGARDPSREGAVLVVDLTSRELEVLELLAKLFTTAEIAAALYISVNTVRTHVRSILRKLAVVRRNDAVRRAWGLGLLTGGRDRSVPTDAVR